MKKRLFVSIILLVLLFGLSACGKTKKEEVIEEEKQLEVDEVIIKDTLYKLNQDENGYGLKYKIASNFRKVDTGNALNYYSEKDSNGNTYFVIRLFYFKNKTIDYAIKDTTETYDSKEEVEINGLKYTKVHFTNFNNANTYLFYYKNKNDVYAYCFTASSEEERLENIFLSQLVYP